MSESPYRDPDGTTDESYHGSAYRRQLDEQLADTNAPGAAVQPKAKVRAADAVRDFIERQQRKAEGLDDNSARRCPACSAVIPTEQINIREGVALCAGCGALHGLGELIERAPAPDVDLGSPPRGCWRRFDGRFEEIGASASNFGAAMLMLFFSLFWNGIVSVFVFFAATAWLAYLGLIQPPSSIQGLPTSLLPLLGMTAFLTPFVLIGLGTFAGVLFVLFGRVVVLLDGADGRIVRGVGPITMTKRFDAGAAIRVGEKIERKRDSSGDVSVQKHVLLTMAEGKPIKFGSSLNDKRRRFVAGALHKALGLDRAAVR